MTKANFPSPLKNLEPFQKMTETCKRLFTLEVKDAKHR